jgi:hypothetical protein
MLIKRQDGYISVKASKEIHIHMNTVAAHGSSRALCIGAAGPAVLFIIALAPSSRGLAAVLLSSTYRKTQGLVTRYIWVKRDKGMERTTTRVFGTRFKARSRLHSQDEGSKSGKGNVADGEHHGW